jgi:hypothetical protein
MNDPTIVYWSWQICAVKGTCSGPWKPGSRCRLSKARGLLRKPKGGSGIRNGEDLGRGRSVYEQPGTKVDRISSCQRRVSK